MEQDKLAELVESKKVRFLSAALFGFVFGLALAGLMNIIIVANTVVEIMKLLASVVPH